MRSGAASSSSTPGTGATDGATALDALAERIRPLALRREDHLPVLPALTSLLPGEGLRRGTTVGVTGEAAGGATSLALALVAAASQAGSWVAAVGLPSLGLVAADELGVALERLVLVAAPERSQWGSVTAALVDGFDCVVVAAHRGVPAAAARRLAARARERGTVLVVLGGGWPERAAVELRIARTRWEGIEPGHGHLRARKVRVLAGGRGDAARPRTVDLWLPAATGGVAPVDRPEPTAAPARPRIAAVAGERAATPRSPAPGSPDSPVRPVASRAGAGPEPVGAGPEGPTRDAAAGPGDGGTDPTRGGARRRTRPLRAVS